METVALASVRTLVITCSGALRKDNFSESSLSILNLRLATLTTGSEGTDFAALRVASDMSGDNDRELVVTDRAGAEVTPRTAGGTDNGLITERVGDLVLVPTSSAGVEPLGSIKGTFGNNGGIPERAGDLVVVPTCWTGVEPLGSFKGMFGDNDLIPERAGDLVLVPTSWAGNADSLGSIKSTSGVNDLSPEGAGVGGRSRDREMALLPLPLPLSSRSPASRTTYGSRGTTRPDLIQLLIHALLSTARVGSPRTEWRAARCSGSVARWPGSRLRMM